MDFPEIDALWPANLPSGQGSLTVLEPYPGGSTSLLAGQNLSYGAQEPTLPMEQSYYYHQIRLGEAHHLLASVAGLL